MAYPALFRRSIVVAAVFAIAETARGADEDPPPLAVIAYNHASIPAGTLRYARDKVIRIYRETGVDLQWTDSPLDSSQPDRDASSNRPNIFTVRMLTRKKRHPVAVGEGMVLGRAVGTSDSGGIVSLFYDQVVRVARTHGQWPGDILGLAIAHEIGHLLLPSPAHSPIGIMRASWDGDDIRHGVVGALRFTP